MPIRLGFIGLSKNGGWAADALAPPILTGPLTEKYALTAVSTSSSASASATSAHYTELAGREVKGYHGSTESISADPDVDLVVVSVKVYEHLAAIMPAVKAGKDLFVEWPLGKNLDEAKAIVRAVKERGVQRTMIGIQDWNIPAFTKVKQWVDAGKIGRVISTSYYGTVAPELAFKGPTLLSKYKYITEPDLGGTFIDIPVAHVFAGVTHALGKLQKVSATTAIGFKEIKLVDAVGSAEGETISAKVPDQFAISGILESGALLSATFSALGASNPPGQPTMVWEVIGTEGKIRMESEGYLTSLAPAIQPPEVVYLNGERFDLKEENAAATPVARAWDAFANGDQANFPTFDDALELHKLVEAIKTSDREGRIVRVDEIQ